MTRSAQGIRVVSLLGLCLVVGASVAQAQAPSGSVAPSSVPGVASASLPPGVEAVSVGDGAVLVGQTGSGQDVALDQAAMAAASAALEGRPIGIVLATGPAGERLSPDTPEVLATQAAIERLGAVPIVCDSVQFRRRQARCGRKNVGAIVVLKIFPGPLLRAPARLIERGLAIAVIDFAPTDVPTDGSVRLRSDFTEAGLAQGRAAGAWAASAWPDADVSVSIDPLGPEPDPFYDTVAQGVLEALPTATILPHSLDPQQTIDANLYTGAIPGRSIAALLQGEALDVEGKPVGVFALSCPPGGVLDPAAAAAGLPTDPRYAGCVDLDQGAIGAAAVDVIARLASGGSVPADISVAVPYEVVLAE